eukprot:TRINITY_DN2703_c0_g1_i1.p1 TRINITY_DN2703_c0_g1~~TRINITY_DN2703_c0_g1_i1.p1  ORF type:complete len:150 (-),score=15.93 TRINITY_DN2703_c0_g1_i1:442-891(-)
MQRQGGMSILLPLSVSVGAATSDHFGFLVGGRVSEDTLGLPPGEGPVDLMLFNRNLEHIDTVREPFIDPTPDIPVEHYFQPQIYSVADSLVVVALCCDWDRDIYDNVVLFTILSVPSGSKTTVALPLEFQTSKRKAARTRRVLTETNTH